MCDFKTNASGVTTREPSPRDVADILRREARRWNDLSWALDSAMSGDRKARDGAYRAGVHGDSGSGGRYVYAGPTIEQASSEALKALRDAGVTI